MIPSEHLPLYLDRIKMFRELPLSQANAAELVRGYGQYLTFRMTLRQMRDASRSNVDIAEWAANTLLSEPVEPQHRRTFGGQLVTITAE